MGSEALEQIERLTRQSRLKRFLSRPLAYVKVFMTTRRSRLFPSGQPAVINTFFGYPMNLLLPSGLDLFLFGAKTHDSEIRLAKFLLDNLNADSVFFDVGAHFGYYTLLAHYANCREIHAFEPAVASFAVLTRNTSHFQNVHTHRTVISDAFGLSDFYEFPLYYAENNTSRPPEPEDACRSGNFRPVRQRMPCQTLDGFVGENGLVPTVVKVDVEGAEKEVVAGFLYNLGKHTITLILEFIRDPGLRENQETILAILTQHGYYPHLINENGHPERFADFEEFLERSATESENVVFTRISN